MEQNPKWYIIQVYSGCENKVARSIEEQCEKKGFRDRIKEILIPTEEVIEIKSGTKNYVDKKCFPGYVLVKMHLTDAVWHVIKGIPKVSGILGSKGKPQPISEAEVRQILEQVKESKEKPKSSVNYEIGDQVRVIDGPFASFSGFVEEIEDDKQKLKVSVMIFGRATPVALEYVQVERI
ncbi:MAG: transcription termination/antitermination protein NusG [Streptococcaceae bacterium]|jgi:transcriptional antiterminator NusG|nr:transcription termination/antitermination protein NusG [Streptococcaceae bacterium]